MQDSSLYSHIQPQFPEQEQLKCPRCDSPNTKFCYYNNYNLSQPRHFCKSCKRYWTKGGALRNIPVGGGSRKATKRSSSSSSATSAAAKRPASAKDKKESEDSNTSGEIAGALPQKGENFGGQFENLSFSSLLGSNGDQFVSLLDGLGPGGPGIEINEHFGDPGSGRNGNPDLEIGGGSGNEGEFLNLHGGGETSCWGGGGSASGSDWPDLAIYTPSSNFQ